MRRASPEHLWILKLSSSLIFTRCSEGLLGFIRIMFFMLILLFLREISGATFINIYENENHWLSCSNTSADQKESRWWLGKDCSSLVQFQPMPCDPSSQCPAGKNPTSRYLNCTQRNVSIAAFPGGGIFACKALSGSNASDPHPLINKEDHCRNFNFFIVAIINNTVGSTFTKELQISLGVVGGIVLISGIILFLCWKKKSKGKAYESQQRDQTTTEMEEDCSPYAVSSRNDIDGNEVVYSLAMSPGVNPDSLYSFPESKSDPGMQPGENVQAIYAVPKKERS
ncbi:uncharacterized protein LOC114584903 isoform X4 [Podarcis muralis]